MDFFLGVQLHFTIDPYNVLSDQEDARECVSDTYLAAWNRIPPARPSLLGAFLGKITRHLSIDYPHRAPGCT